MKQLLINKILIKNSPAFVNVELVPNRGFNVFSGSSGAGKSVLMQSILAFFGIVDSNAEILEIAFEISGADGEFYGMFDDGEMVLSIVRRDKVRYFLNAQQLPRKRVLEIFSPFVKHLGAKAREISDEDLCEIFDSFCAASNAAHMGLCDDYKKAYENFIESKTELKELQVQNQKIVDLAEFVRFEIEKIEKLNPREGEFEELLAQKKALSRKEKIAQSAANVREFLQNSSVVNDFLSLTNRDESGFNTAMAELELLLSESENELEELDGINPEDLLDRIESLSALNHRYGGISQALEVLAQKKEELKKYENIEEHLKSAQDDFNAKSAILQEAAQKLSTSRQKHLESFCSTLNANLNALKMPQCSANLEILEQNTKFGAEKLELKLAKNTHLRDISSGELNRLKMSLLLCSSSLNLDSIENKNIESKSAKSAAKNALSAKTAAVIILDEVDANLSGAESESIAKALYALSFNYQIFAISHQPHMPRYANSHYLVQKSASTPQSSQIIELDYNGRVNEIARMISGEEISPQALNYAKEALKDFKE